MKLRLCPVSRKDAQEFVAVWHRHNRPPPGDKFRMGVCDEDGILHAVCIVGRPVARHFDDGDTLEVTRIASDGIDNACSMLYGAARRATFAIGYRRLITYTREDESGSSLKAADYKVIAARPARKGWDSPSRPRDNSRHAAGVPRLLWETVNDVL